MEDANSAQILLQRRQAAAPVTTGPLWLRETPQRIPGSTEYTYRVYDNGLRRSVNYTINRALFASDKAMFDEIAARKANQLKINRQRVMAEPEDAPQVLTAHGTLKSNPSFMSPQFTAACMWIDAHTRSDIKLDLDAGTGNSGALFGSSKSGKTTAMMAIYRKYYQKEPDGSRGDSICTLFAANSQIPAYKTDKRLIRYDHFDNRAHKYIDLQQRINRRTSNAYEFANFIDDFTRLRNDEWLDKLILSYRNSNISTWICLQAAKRLDKSQRSSVNHVMLFRNNNQEMARDIVELFLEVHFARMGVTSRLEQSALYEYATKAHGFIHLAQNAGVMTFYRLQI